MKRYRDILRAILFGASLAAISSASIGQEQCESEWNVPPPSDTFTATITATNQYPNNPNGTVWDCVNGTPIAEGDTIYGSLGYWMCVFPLVQNVGSCNVKAVGEGGGCVPTGLVIYRYSVGTSCGIYYQDGSYSDCYGTDLVGPMGVFCLATYGQYCQTFDATNLNPETGTAGPVLIYPAHSVLGNNLVVLTVDPVVGWDCSANDDSAISTEVLTLAIQVNCDMFADCTVGSMTQYNDGVPQ
jgi:hypothetical protein